MLTPPARSRSSAPSYAAIGIYQPGQTKPSLMSVKGRIVVFDHPSQAADYLPLLGGGRVTQWVDGENAFWLPLDPRGTNRACIITDYDPYGLPPGMPVPSETRGKEWKGHIHAAYVFHDCGQMVQRQTAHTQTRLWVSNDLRIGDHIEKDRVFRDVGDAHDAYAGRARLPGR